tara:strand:+ start:318 stop:440 length:123 start_codon:yes stop_codon:yes gene_type:complete
MSEQQESKIREQVLLMIARNPGKHYITRRILKRFERCLKG